MYVRIFMVTIKFFYDNLKKKKALFTPEYQVNANQDDNTAKTVPI